MCPQEPKILAGKHCQQLKTHIKLLLGTALQPSLSPCAGAIADVSQANGANVPLHQLHEEPWPAMHRYPKDDS